MSAYVPVRETWRAPASKSVAQQRASFSHRTAATKRGSLSASTYRYRWRNAERRFSGLRDLCSLVVRPGCCVRKFIAVIDPGHCPAGQKHYELDCLRFNAPENRHRSLACSTFRQFLVHAV